MRSQGKSGILFGVAAVGAAIATELSKPAEERTWLGKIAGMVPSDLRRPTAEGVKEKVWNPGGGFLSPSIFGVGWVPNVGRIAAEAGLLGRHQESADGESSQ